jgi:hypothetical protein
MSISNRGIAAGGAVIIAGLAMLRPDTFETAPDKSPTLPPQVTTCAEAVVDDFFLDNFDVLARENNALGPQNSHNIVLTATALAEKACDATTDMVGSDIAIQMTPLACIEHAGRSAVVLSVQSVGEDGSLTYLDAERPSASFGPLPAGC